MTYLLIFFTSLIATIFLTPFFITFLKNSKIVDYPGGRKIHTEIMPRMGGLIIFVIVLVMINAFVEDFNSIKLIIVSATILVFSGIIDDVLGLNNFIKFVIQNISAVILIFYLEQHYTEVLLFGYTFSSPFDYLILLLFIVGTINSINFLDGLDGLASGFSILIFSVLLALAIRKDDTFLILLTVSLLGSTLGFLRFNAFPASVFLGDTGSLILGFFLILIASLTSINYHHSALDLTFPLILLALPLVDTLKVFVLRLIRKRDPFSADNSHQHHILKRSIVNHEITVFIIEIFSLVFIFISLLYLIDKRLEAVILFFIFTGLLLAIHPLLVKVNIAKFFNFLLVRIHDFPMKKIFPIISVGLFFSGILILAISILSFSYKTSLNVEEIFFLLIMVSGLLSLAIFQSKKIGDFSQVNVFLNFSIFFIISKLSLPSVFNEELTIQIITSLQEWSFYALSTILTITLVLRWKALMTRKLFFNGTDLTMVVFILLTIILNNILEFDLNYYLSISLLEAFIFYVWYKLVIDIKKTYEFGLTLLSFLLPTSLLLTLLIASQL
ncbi:MAG: undecaprenyl/decaprenyl-phosphate alpha-N-acetylglucosaminyl 1-phosphate transferase [Melioribacteraceae bacterium]|nr:undecaprenyl/decaprenyl-phosphate alpha-N-acetylglucosaminyl 1-phosphate transferase [Melioribacteraceae bacterium]